MTLAAYVSLSAQAVGAMPPRARIPRYSSPMSFLGRVPYSLALLATAVGLVLLLGGAAANRAVLARGFLSHRDDAASVNFAINFTQKVDHFDSLNHDTFHQRYWENQRWWKVPTQAKAHPLAFLRINSFHWDGDWNTSTIATWAKELGAIVFDLEPRYAGKSYPVPDVSTRDLRYYSIEQNVADVVNFIQDKSTLLPNNTRWIVMGDLFDGAFATWVRAKPRVAFGVVATSPHLLAVEGYTGYDLAYQASIGRTCSRIVHDLLGTVSFTLNWSAEARAAYQVQCGVDEAELLPNAEFMYVVSTILMGAMGYDSINMCKTFSDVRNSDNATRLEALANYTVQYNEDNYMTFKQWDFALDTGGNMTDYGAGYRPTYYLKCTQLGQFEVSSGSPYSLVPAEVNVDWYLSVCQKLFNNLTTARPNTDDVNTNFGGGVPTGCNMAFVQSANDPYSSLGPNAAALAEDYATTGNKIIEIDCESTSIGLSLFSTPTSADVACLVTARSQVLKTLKVWQAQEDTCPMSTTVVDGGSSGHDDGDMALVGVFSAVGGVILGLVVAVVLFLYFGRRVIQRWKTSFFSKIN
jgi:hypothetical protein